MASAMSSVPQRLELQIAKLTLWHQDPVIHHVHRVLLHSLPETNVPTQNQCSERSLQLESREMKSRAHTRAFGPGETGIFHSLSASVGPSLRPEGVGIGEQRFVVMQGVRLHTHRGLEMIKRCQQSPQYP